jgi:hypothetical protein
MQHQLILVVGLLLTTCLPGEAQTLATRVFVAPARPEQAMTFVRPSPTRAPQKASLTAGQPRKPAAQFTVLITPAYMPDRGRESQSLQAVVRTPLLTESRVTIVQFCRGRLQLDRFESTLHMQNVHLGPPGFGGLFPIHDQAGLASSASLEGISLVFRFGRNAQVRSQPQVWRCLGLIRGNSRGCPL